MIRKLIVGSILTLVVSLYVFPISFTFLPNSINSKMIVAVFGILAYVFDSLRRGSAELSSSVLMAGLLSVIFSVWCLFSITVSNTPDKTYVMYIVSFATWLAGAYGVYAALRLAYEHVDMEILVRYLALAGGFQCVTAVLIDNNAGFAAFVDRFMDVGQDFYKKGHRLYGIGAALDPAGIRFSVIQVLNAHVFATNTGLRSNSRKQLFLLLAFSVIIIIGSVISRTTLVGSGLGLLYIGVSLVRLRKGGFVTLRMLQIYVTFLFALAGVLAFSIYYYYNSMTYHEYLRFGFEAFFNWAETGEFRTSSGDHLNTMWVWPKDSLTWLIGRGTFGVYQNNTDIGYCNFIFYCGIIGLVLFSVFFLYCHLVQNRKFKNFRAASLMLVALTFIVWVKVTTDIFFIDALLFCIAGDDLSDVPDEGSEMSAAEPEHG